jgi:hypothetical protein
MKGQTNQDFFPFHLEVARQHLVVTAHGLDLSRRLRRLRPSRATGWAFKVKGAYAPDVAEKAWNNARNDTPENIVGLHAAVRAYLRTEVGIASG